MLLTARKFCRGRRKGALFPFDFYSSSTKNRFMMKNMFFLKKTQKVVILENMKVAAKASCQTLFLSLARKFFKLLPTGLEQR
jgi:hypothetical protein